MTHLRRLAIVAAVLVVLALLAAIVPSALNPSPPDEEKRRRDSRWVSSSPYWLDRQACRWLSLCGVMHLRWDPAFLSSTSAGESNDDDYADLRQELRRRSWSAGSGGGGNDDLARGVWEEWERRRATKAEWRKNKARKHASLREIPKYVLEHAPLVHLFSGEHFWPSDILEHVRHVTPFVEDEPLNTTASLSRLHHLNRGIGLVSLKSDDDVESRPDWLYGQSGIPVPFRDPPTEDDLVRPRKTDPARLPLEDATWFDVKKGVPLHRISPPSGFPGSRLQRRPDPDPNNVPPMHAPLPTDPAHNETSNEGYSGAPAVLILVDKAPGILDAYWFFFYSYNLGQTVGGVRFGNHVGDWEHCMIRFQDGFPQAVYLSEHEGGQAFIFGAMERYRRWPKRPVVYSAVGSHAMYALPGKHPYVLPFGMLADYTDRGPLWDPAKNTYAYFYDHEADGRHPGGGSENVDGDENSETPGVADPPANNAPPRRENKSLVPAASNPEAPTSWFHYAGVWGDNLYGLADMRQWRLFMQYHYVTGPRGPKDKHLDRQKMCPRAKCRLLDHLDPHGTWY